MNTIQEKLQQEIFVTDETLSAEEPGAEEPGAEEPGAEEPNPENPAASPDSPVTTSREVPARSLELALTAARTAAENGGTEIVVLDMSGHTAIFDFFVIATGTSRRQIRSMGDEIDHKLEDELKDKRLNIDGKDDSRWIVLDYGTVVIHLFDDNTRIFYSLEALWDAPQVDLTETLANIRH